jgi:hypothetical protein
MFVSLKIFLTSFETDKHKTIFTTKKNYLKFIKKKKVNKNKGNGFIYLRLRNIQGKFI